MEDESLIVLPLSCSRPKSPNCLRPTPRGSIQVHGLWVLILGVGLVLSPVRARAQQRDSAQARIDRMVRAFVHSDDAVWARGGQGPEDEPYLTMRRLPFRACACNWTRLSAWEVWPGTQFPGRVMIAEVADSIYPLVGLPFTDFHGLVNALLQLDKTQKRSSALDCIVETIAAILTNPGRDFSDTGAPDGEGPPTQIRRGVLALLPQEWPRRGTTKIGDHWIVQFTVFYSLIGGDTPQFVPVAFELTFGPDLRVLSWATRVGETIPL